MLKNNKRILSLVALFSVLLTGCELIPVEESFQAAPIFQEEVVEEYSQTVVLRGDLVNTEKVTCKYSPAISERLSFSISGELISDIFVEAGQMVEAGDLLAELEESNVDVQIEDQEHLIQTLQMQITHLKENRNLTVGLESAQETSVQSQLKAIDDRLSQIAQRLAQIDAEIEAALAAAATQPSEPAETQPVGTEQTQPAPTEAPQPTEPVTAHLEEEKATLLAEQGELTQARKNLTQEQTGLAQKENVSTNTYENQLQNLEDALYIAQLHLSALQKAQRERRIYAGINGMVTYARKISDRTFCEEGKTVIELADMNTLAFVVSGDSAEYFPVGTKTVVECDGMEYKVEAVEATQLGLPEPEEGTQIAYLHLLQNAVLENGDSGKVEVILEESRDTLYIEKEAIHTMNGKHFVYMLNEDGLRMMQDVTVGIVSGGYIEIKKGLSEGDSVILG